MPGMGQSPGSRFLCLGPRRHTVRTKGASFCFNAPAARLPHRYISAAATRDLLLPFFSLTDRSNTLSPGPLPPPLPAHALHAGSSFQLRLGIGQFCRLARAREGEVLPETYCAGLVLGAAL